MKRKKYKKPAFISQKDWDEYLHNIKRLGKNLFKKINDAVKETNTLFGNETIDDLEFLPIPDDNDKKKKKKRKK